MSRTVTYLCCILWPLFMFYAMHDHNLHCIPHLRFIPVLHMRYLVQYIHAVREYLCCISILHPVVLIYMFAILHFYAVFHAGHLLLVSCWVPVLCSLIAIHGAFCIQGPLPEAPDH